MPEGPEVANFFLDICEVFAETLRSVDILSGRYLKTKPKGWESLELPCEIETIFVKGKSIFIKLGQRGIVITHGMSGYWSYERTKHSRLYFETDVGGVYFDDIRNFGTLTVCDGICEFEERVNKLGPDILGSNLTYEDFWSRLGKKRNAKIGSAMLDQNLVAGIGNYLRCDILWYCGIDGEAKIKDLTDEQKRTLFKNSMDIARYHAGKTTELELLPEQFGRDFFVYMQETDPYGNEVYTKTLGSRTFHYTNCNKNIRRHCVK